MFDNIIFSLIEIREYMFDNIIFSLIEIREYMFDNIIFSLKKIIYKIRVEVSYLSISFVPPNLFRSTIYILFLIRVN